MPDKPHKNIQTPGEMLTSAKEQRMNNRIYSRTSDGSEVVSAVVNQLAAELATLPQKTDLRNTAQIEKICISYVDACSKAGLIPSKIGLSRAMGVSRRTIDYFISKYPDHPTAQLLEIVFDGFSDCLNTAALCGAVNNIYSIFLSKAIFHYKDTVTLEAIPADPLERRMTTEEIIKKYELVDLPDD